MGDSRASEDAANDSLSDGSQDVTDRWVGDGALLGASEQGYGVTPEDDQPKKSIGARSCLSKSSVASRGRCVSWKASDSKKMSAHSSFSFCKTGNVESPRRSELFPADLHTHIGDARRNAKSCAFVSSTDTLDDSSPKTLKIADAEE